MGKSGGPKISNFQKYRVTVRESSYKFFLLFTGLWAIDGTKLWSFGHLHMTPSAKNQPKMAYGLFWANFENSLFLTIFEVSYGPKQWRYQVFSGKIVFSAVQNPHTWILSPTPREYYGFQGPSKVRFSAFKVVAQENFHWCFVKEYGCDNCVMFFFSLMGVVCKNTYMLACQIVAFSILYKRAKQ